jgi:arabinofuranosyltransferase
MQRHAEGIKSLAVLLLITVALIFIMRAAWISDDALITFRVINNFVEGRGPVFNLHERVQAYTHPLWFFVNSIPYYFTKEAFLTPILVSLLFSLAAIYILLVKIGKDLSSMFLGLAFLLNSKAFMDYTSSGLENPLTYFLLAVFGYFALMTDRQANWIWLCGVAAGLFLNRYDTILLVAPTLIWTGVELLRIRRYRILFGGALVFALPVVSWFFFSLIYYGTIFPNTAYAKLNTGIPDHQLYAQGLLYLIDFIDRDLVGFFIVCSAIAWGLSRSGKPLFPVALGILCSVIYVIKVGGDFMTGRFFTPAIFFSATLLLSQVKAPNFRIAVPLTLLAGSLLACLFFNQSLDDQARDPLLVHESGIADEKAFHFRDRGLISPAMHRSKLFLPPHQKCTAENPQMSFICGGLGFAAFSGCASHVFIDTCALADPFLARLPVESGKIAHNNWRVGHYERAVPPEYINSIKEGLNEFPEHDPRRRAFEEVKKVTQGPLFDGDRVRLIFAGRWGTPDSVSVQ